MYKAKLVGVYFERDTPEELRPFVNIEAKRRERDLKPGDKYIALQVEGSLSYIVFFLDTIDSVEQLEGRLSELECELTPASRASIEKLIAHRKGIA